MDAEGEAKPRINGSLLPKFTGKAISIVARYIRVDGGLTLVLESSDGQTLSAKLLQPLHEPPTPFVEVVGQVGYDCTITVNKIINYGSDLGVGKDSGVVFVEQVMSTILELDSSLVINIDLANYNEAIKYSQQFPQFFSAGS